jgi:hypothetical protein
MKTISTSIRISAPAATVWAILTETARFPQWNPFVTELDGSLEVGERLRVRIAPPGGKGMTFRPRVTEMVPNHRLAWLGSLGIRGLFDGAHSFTIEPQDDGGCLVIHSEIFRGLLVPLMPGTFEQTEAGFRLMNEALRERAESMVAAA